MTKNSKTINQTLKIKKIEDRSMNLERLSRRDYLLISELAGNKFENCEKIVKNLFVNLMGIHETADYKMVRVHRLRMLGRGQCDKVNPHMMIVRFQEYQDREYKWNKKNVPKDKPFFFFYQRGFP